VFRLRPVHLTVAAPVRLGVLFRLRLQALGHLYPRLGVVQPRPLTAAVHLRLAVLSLRLRVLHGHPYLPPRLQADRHLQVALEARSRLRPVPLDPRCHLLDHPLDPPLAVRHQALTVLQPVHRDLLQLRHRLLILPRLVVLEVQSHPRQAHLILLLPVAHGLQFLLQPVRHGHLYLPPALPAARHRLVVPAHRSHPPGLRLHRLQHRRLGVRSAARHLHLDLPSAVLGQAPGPPPGQVPGLLFHLRRVVLEVQSPHRPHLQQAAAHLLPIRPLDPQ